ncbi:MAG: MFS transporter [Henriciella sp.]|nr:MFS transporter [Henriciella sp.]
MSELVERKPSNNYVIYVVIMLSIVNLFNFMDRMLMAVLLPDIQADLNLTDTQLGILTGFAFALFYAIFGVPLARLADIWSRTGVISISIAFWSAATALCGAAGGFLTMLLARMGVGIGEAGGTPPSHSLISDYVSEDRRATALAIHTVGATLGMSAGLALGGVLSDTIGWRWTFVCFGVPGIILALIVAFTIREIPRGYSDNREPDTAGAPALSETLKYFVARKSYVYVVIAMSVGAFLVNGINQWLPTFYFRNHGLTQTEIGIFFGIALGFGYALGAISGGILADRLNKRDIRFALYLGIAALVVSVPAWIAVLVVEDVRLALGFNFLAAFLSNIVAGPLLAIIQSVAPPRMRAMSTAIYILLAAIVGVGAGPFIVGYVSDILKPMFDDQSLRYALLFTLSFTIIPVLALWRAGRFVEHDIATAKAY